MRRPIRIAAWIAGVAVLLPALAIGVLQTGPARAWLAATIAGAASSPGATIRVGTITGFVPFDIAVDRIDLADEAGPWLVIRQATLAWSPSALLRGRLRVDRLAADSITMIRQPAPSPPAAQSSGGFALPRLPVGVELRDLAVGRLAVDPAVGGDTDAAARLSAHGELVSGRAALAIRATRIDGQPGAGSIDANYDQAADALTLAVDIDEPTGALLDAALGRTDRLPLRVTLQGSGPLDGWRGRLTVTARDAIRADAAIEIAHTAGTRIALEGSIGIAALMAENVREFAGNDIKFRIVAAASGTNALMVAPSEIVLAGATMTVEGGQAEDGALSGKLSLVIPDSAALEPLAGVPAQGPLRLDAVLSGTADHPRLAMTEREPVSIGGVTVDGISLDAQVDSANANTAHPIFSVDVAAKTGNVSAADGGAGLGPVTLKLNGTTDAKGSLIDIGGLSASGAGFDIAGKGSFRDGKAEGSATMRSADLAVLGTLLGLPLAGGVTANLRATTDAGKTIAVQASAKGERLETGIDAADALLAGSVTLDASATRSADGRIVLDRLALASPRARVEGSGAFEQQTGAIAANVKATLADIAALSNAAGGKLAGTGVATAALGGTIDAPTLDASVTLDRFAFAATRIDHLDATIAAPRGLAGSATIKGSIVSGKLAESIDAEVARAGEQAYRLNRLHLAGSGGTVDGAILADVKANRISGRLSAAIPDLSIWSGVAGQRLAGRVALSVDLPEAAGRQGPITADIDRLTLTSATIATARLDGQVSGDLARPAGTVRLTLAGLTAGGASVSTADATVTAHGSTLDFQAQGAGRADDAFSVKLAGSAKRSGATTNLGLSLLSASLGAEKIALARPAAITIGPGVYGLQGLALSVGGGSITGNAALSPAKLSGDLQLRNLPLHAVGLLAGEKFVAGTLDGTVALTGTPKRPEGHLAMTTAGLDVQSDGPRPRPSLALSAKADWQNDRATVKIALASGTGETLNVAGSAPLAFDLVNFRAVRPADPALALTVTGGGRLEHLTAIVPLGEDRIAGAFSVDVSVGGTIAAPSPAGRITVTGGTYVNQAFGTAIDGIDMLVSGAGERFVLDHLTATDGASGTMSASGSVDLGARPATIALDLGFKDFRVARSDDATASADAALTLAGTTAGLTASGTIGIRHAELYIPERLPAGIVDLQVTEKGAAPPASPAHDTSAPLAPVDLAIAVDAPGQIFVRGRGVTSEWRTHLDIGGSTAAPSVVGDLSVLNGQLALLGQTFTIDRGVVHFGGTDLNPVLDVKATAQASGVTAAVDVTGTARAPKIALSSTPALPQDEILSRVLFGQSAGSLTATQGIQLAAAAASLAQGGPGILDKVRNAIGLDRLDVGSAATNAGVANPTTAGSGTSGGTTVSGGKYVAEGVYVGVAQGLSGTTQAQVQIEVTPNISVNSTFGAGVGSGFGAKYSIDY